MNLKRDPKVNGVMMCDGVTIGMNVCVRSSNRELENRVYTDNYQKHFADMIKVVGKLDHFSLEGWIIVQNDGNHSHVAEGPSRPAKDILAPQPHLTRHVQASVVYLKNGHVRQRTTQNV